MWCEARSITNIEDLLTAAYVSNFAAKNSAVSGLIDYFLFRDREDNRSSRSSADRRFTQPSSVDASSVALFQETLQGLFGLLTSTMIPADPNPAHTAITEFVEQHKLCSIVTTNYDGCIDEALIKKGILFHSHVEPDAAPPGGNAIDLIKMHGSINWNYCDSCHHVKVFDLIDLKTGFNNDDRSYAVVGICRKCGGQRRPLLIPPTGLKFVQFPSLITLWNRAREGIELGDYVIVVGFSFSEADSYINRIIERSMSTNKKQVMLVVDPNPALVPWLRKRYSARTEAFDEKRILGVRGNAEEWLPKILAGLTARAEKTKASTNSNGGRFLDAPSKLRKPKLNKHSRRDTPSP